MKAADQKQEHADSYYAASVNDVTAYPHLEGARSADVCVVGAGFTGTATTLSLAERVSRYDVQCDFNDSFLQVATKPGQVRYLDEYVEDRESHPSDFAHEIWDREKTCDMLGADAYHGGFVCFRDGHLHPLNLCIGEARAAHCLGLHIFEQSPVTGITHGKRPRVETANGYVEADSVVLAGNAYSQFEPKRLSNLVFPAGSYIIATEPLADDVANSIIQKDLAVCDLNEVVDYYRLSADNSRRCLRGRSKFICPVSAGKSTE